MNKEEVITEIIEGIINFKVIPFFGAGMSKPCGALDWSELVDGLKSELNTISTDHLQVAQEFEDEFGRAALLDKLKKGCELRILNSDSLANHMKILAMNPPIVYTTNYDNALEEAAMQLQRDYKPVICLKDIVESKHGQKQIIKFHGDFSDSESIVFTRKDYDKRLKADENHLDILFRSHILGKSVLFLGYGFGDENIDSIFQKHTELYGTENLPKSYIISFSHNPKREKEFQDKNIITIELEDPSELCSLIDEVSMKVFQMSVDAQFESMFNPLPSILLSRFELNHLIEYVDSPEYSGQEKHDKIRDTIEGKSIPKDVEELLVNFFERVIADDYDFKIKEAILISFQHTNFREMKSVFKLSLDLLSLTKYPEFTLNFGSDNWGADVLMSIEHKLSVALNESVKCREWMCHFILIFLEGMIGERKELTSGQVERLLDGLKDYGYEDFDKIGFRYDRDKIHSIVEHYLSQQGPTLRMRFESKGLFGKRTPTSMEIMEDMMKSLPKGMGN